METLEQKDTVETDALAPRSIEDIKASYPDEWILLGNPEDDEYDRTISGVVLYHGPDKRELAYRDKPLLQNYQKKAIFFNRVTPLPKRPVIASIFSTLKPWNTHYYPIGDIIETGQVETANGIVEVDIIQTKAISAFGHTVRDMKVQMYDFLKRGVISDYDGVLGLDFFKNTEFTIDMVNQTIEVKN